MLPQQFTFVISTFESTEHFFYKVNSQGEKGRENFMLQHIQNMTSYLPAEFDWHSLDFLKISNQKKTCHFYDTPECGNLIRIWFLSNVSYSKKFNQWCGMPIIGA